MPRILITGAAGFIGMHTAIRFLKEGWNVIGLDNFNSYYSVDLKRDRLKEIIKVSKLVSSSFEMIEKDLNSDVWLSDLNQLEFDAIVHLAAQAGVRYSIENPRAYLESNILGFQSILDFAVKKGISRFCYASSSSVYGKNSAQPFSENARCDEPESYYAATKRANELMAYTYFKTQRFNSIGLRFFTVYGPWGRPDMAPMIFTNAAYRQKSIRVFNYGNQKRDFTYIDDIVEGIFGLIISESSFTKAEVLNIGYGNPTPLTKFMSLIESKTGRKLKKKLVEAQKGDVAETYADTQRLNSMTGFKPRISLTEGVRRTVDWFEKYYDF